jgi:hypothetical protein
MPITLLPAPVDAPYVVDVSKPGSRVKSGQSPIVYLSGTHQETDPRTLQWRVGALRATVETSKKAAALAALPPSRIGNGHLHLKRKKIKRKKIHTNKRN